MRTSIKTALIAIFAVATLGLAACSGSSSSTESPSASPSATQTSATAQAGVECTTEAFAAVVPNDANINLFKCADVGDGQVAAIQYGPGVNVVFARATAQSSQWEIVNKDTICGTASAGLPAEILALCNK